MKSRPILFRGDMVRAILDGRKTQTRRILPEWQRPGKTSGNTQFPEHAWMAIVQRHPRYGFGAFGETEERCVASLNTYASACPYGQPGDRLWVRETWACVAGEAGNVASSADTVYFECDRAHVVVPHSKYRQDDGKPVRWRPNIHMPSYYSRITLEIVRVRVERLQDIAEADAMAEGFTADESCDLWAKHEFCHTWKKLYGNESWTANPWVWVVEFKRVTP